MWNLSGITTESNVNGVNIMKTMINLFHNFHSVLTNLT
jgi:hypothetical protein